MKRTWYSAMLWQWYTHFKLIKDWSMEFQNIHIVIDWNGKNCASTTHFLGNFHSRKKKIINYPLAVCSSRLHDDTRIVLCIMLFIENCWPSAIKDRAALGFTQRIKIRTTSTNAIWSCSHGMLLHRAFSSSGTNLTPALLVRHENALFHTDFSFILCLLLLAFSAQNRLPTSLLEAATTASSGISALPGNKFYVPIVVHSHHRTVMYTLTCFSLKLTFLFQTSFTAKDFYSIFRLF